MNPVMPWWGWVLVVVAFIICVRLEQLQFEDYMKHRNYRRGFNGKWVKRP